MKAEEQIVLKYKYQNILDEFQLIDCPGLQVNEIEMEAYRWCHSPISHEWNFLPNIIYDRVRKRPPRMLNRNEICGNCNLSFFTTEATARDKYNFIKAGLEKKHRHLTDFYTHIAYGKILKEDGRATQVKDNHFGFYEFEENSFVMKFELLPTVL